MLKVSKDVLDGNFIEGMACIGGCVAVNQRHRNGFDDTNVILRYFLYNLTASVPAFLLIFDVDGVFTAMTAGVERALIAGIAPAELKGTMPGLHSTISGVVLRAAADHSLFKDSPNPFIDGCASSRFESSIHKQIKKYTLKGVFLYLDYNAYFDTGCFGLQKLHFLF